MEEMLQTSRDLWKKFLQMKLLKKEEEEEEEEEGKLWFKEDLDRLPEIEAMSSAML